jgi:hypothetical protein
MAQRLGWALVVVMVAAVACAGDQTTTETIASSTTTTIPTETTAPTSTSTTTTTLPPTTTTLGPTAEELRSEFLASLDGDEWSAYADPVIGWTIRYPADWEIWEDNPFDRFVLTTPGGGVLIVSAALDADDLDDGSASYFDANVDYAVEGGLLREPPTNGWFWLDHDFDDAESPTDIFGVEASLAIDTETGEPLAPDARAPVWWYGYYDPDSRPAYGYIFQTLGTDPLLFQLVDDVVLSFEPPPPTGAQSGDPSPEAGLDALQLLEWNLLVRSAERQISEEWGWEPWTTDFSDEQLVETANSWCSLAATVGDVAIESSPGWLFDHPVAFEIERFLADRDQATMRQLSYSVEFMLVRLLDLGICPEIQPSFDPQTLLDRFWTEAIEFGYIDEALPSEPEGDLYAQIQDAVFGTCTNIDQRDPEETLTILVSDDFSWSLAIPAMRTAATQVCPGLAGEVILAWADAGYPEGG